MGTMPDQYAPSYVIDWMNDIHEFFNILNLIIIFNHIVHKKWKRAIKK